MGQSIAAFFLANISSQWPASQENPVPSGTPGCQRTTNNMSFLSGARVAARKTNEVLLLVLTPSGNNVVFTGRVLDRDNAEAVIYETSVLDTPASDESLTAAQIGISRAVQVGWVCPAGISYGIESAPTLQGPWLPVNPQVPPGMQQLAVPSSKSAEFFRLQLAP
jgi:hypothetical protein